MVACHSDRGSRRSPKRRKVAGGCQTAAIKRSLILKAAKPLVITLLKLAKRLRTSAVQRPPVQACEAAQNIGGSATARTNSADAYQNPNTKI